MIILQSAGKKLSLLLSFIIVSIFAIAQETKKIEIDINTSKDDQWYSQPWAWVAGGAIFVLLLVVLFRRRKD